MGDFPALTAASAAAGEEDNDIRPIKKGSEVPGTAATAGGSAWASKFSAVSLSRRAASLSGSAAHGFIPGAWSRRAKDDSLFALVDGIVTFQNLDKRRKKVSVYPSAAR